MNITFLIGVVIGLLLAIAFFFALIVWVCRSIENDNKKRWKETQTFNEITVELMRQRNQIDRATEGHLKKLAEWCENNWTR